MKYQTISLFFTAKGAIYYVNIAMVIFFTCEDMFSRTSLSLQSISFVFI